MESYDVIIIGAGPTGLSCGIAAKKYGLGHLILEKGALVNSIYHFPTNMTFFSTSKNLEIGGVPFISHADKPTRKEALEYYRRLQEAHDLNIHFYEAVNSIQTKGDAYEVQTTKGVYPAKNVVVATGYYGKPNLMGVPGEDLPKVKHYYDEPHPYVGQRVVVVGGANSACDVALETWQKGADVTMVVRGSELYEKVKYWIRPNILNRIREGSIQAYFNSHIREIQSGNVLIQTPEGSKTIANDYVLAMTGYTPDYGFLENLGIEISKDKDRRPKFNPKTLESNRSGIYLAGVLLGGMRTSEIFIENSRHHGELIMSAIQGITV
jgi:thioredoxin reductase (NADPH)